MPDYKDLLSRFVERQNALLNKEQAEEEREYSILWKQANASELQKRGVVLLHLKISGIRTGLGGHSLVEFELGASTGSDNGALPSHQFRPGDLVEIDAMAKESRADELTKYSGSVYRVRETSITIVSRKVAGTESPFEELESSGIMFWRLNKMASEISYKRMRKGIDCFIKPELSSFTKLNGGGDPNLLMVLMGTSSPRFREIPAISFFDDSLNDSQKEAVYRSVAAEQLAIIHGPPGTGKTHTVVEVVRQLVSRGQRVLVCGPSNISVDNLVERLQRHKLDIVRLGNPARVLDSVLMHSLDARLPTSDAGKLVVDIQKDMTKLLVRLKKVKSKGERRAIYSELKQLRDDLKKKERQAVTEIVGNAAVVLGTLISLGSKTLEQVSTDFTNREIVEPLFFDAVVIDEAGQALEPECWIALSKARKLILAGDHLQLPPTVKSSKEVEKSLKDFKALKSKPMSKLELNDTLLDRMVALHGAETRIMLQVQYRANELIMRYSSKALYEGKLIAWDGVKMQTLADLNDKILRNETTESPLLFYDTTGFDLFEQETGNEAAGVSESRMNQGEVDIVKAYVTELLEYNVPESAIGVITPYNGQVQLLKQQLLPKHPLLEIGTVDGFQGREKPVIIISMVRSNDDAEIGFLSDVRRMNVAVTRGQRQVVLIGDSETVTRRGQDVFLKGLVEFFTDNGEIRNP